MTGLSLMSTSLLVLELWQLSILRDWLEIWIYPSLSYWLLQNAGVTAFTVSELLRENQQRITPPHLMQIWVKYLKTNNLWKSTPSLIVGLGRTMTNMIHSYKFYSHNFIILESYTLVSEREGWKKNSLT